MVEDDIPSLDNPPLDDTSGMQLARHVTHGQDDRLGLKKKPRQLWTVRVSQQQT